MSSSGGFSVVGKAAPLHERPDLKNTQLYTPAIDKNRLYNAFGAKMHKLYNQSQDEAGNSESPAGLSDVVRPIIIEMIKEETDINMQKFTPVVVNEHVVNVNINLVQNQEVQKFVKFITQEPDLEEPTGVQESTDLRVGTEAMEVKVIQTLYTPESKYNGTEQSYYDKATVYTNVDDSRLQELIPPMHGGGGSGETHAFPDLNTTHNKANLLHAWIGWWSSSSKLLNLNVSKFFSFGQWIMGSDRHADYEESPFGPSEMLKLMEKHVDNLKKDTARVSKRIITYIAGIIIQASLIWVIPVAGLAGTLAALTLIPGVAPGLAIGALFYLVFDLTFVTVLPTVVFLSAIFSPDKFDHAFRTIPHPIAYMKHRIKELMVLTKNPLADSRKHIGEYFKISMCTATTYLVTFLHLRYKNATVDRQNEKVFKKDIVKHINAFRNLITWHTLTLFDQTHKIGNELDRVADNKSPQFEKVDFDRLNFRPYYEMRDLAQVGGTLKAHTADDDGFVLEVQNEVANVDDRSKYLNYRVKPVSEIVPLPMPGRRLPRNTEVTTEIHVYDAEHHEIEHLNTILGKIYMEPIKTFRDVIGMYLDTRKVWDREAINKNNDIITKRTNVGECLFFSDWKRMKYLFDTKSLNVYEVLTDFISPEKGGEIHNLLPRDWELKPSGVSLLDLMISDRDNHDNLLLTIRRVNFETKFSSAHSDLVQPLAGGSGGGNAVAIIGCFTLTLAAAVSAVLGGG